MDIFASEIARTAVTMTGQKIALPGGDVEVVATMFKVGQGDQLTVHRHPYPRFGFVLAGELTVFNKDANLTKRLIAGEFAVESVDQWHQGTSSGGQALEILIIDLVPLGTPTNTDGLPGSG